MSIPVEERVTGEENRENHSTGDRVRKATEEIKCRKPEPAMLKGYQKVNTGVR